MNRITRNPTAKHFSCNPMEVGQESVTQNEASVVPVQDIEPVVIPEDTTVSQLRTIFLESIITNDFEQFSAAVEFYKCHSHLHEDQSDIFVEKLPLVMLVSKLGRLNYLQKLLELPIGTRDHFPFFYR